MQSRDNAGAVAQVQPDVDSAASRPGIAAQAARQAAGDRAVQAISNTPVATRDNPDQYEQQFAGTAFVKGPGDRAAADPHDVHQGLYSTDCWLLSALMSIARVDPALIESMVTPAGAGSYNVTFYSSDLAALAAWVKGGGAGKTPRKQRKTLTVSASFPVEQSGAPGYANVGETGSAGPELWVMLIEKAIATELGGYAGLVELPSSLGLYFLTPDDLGPGGGMQIIDVPSTSANALLLKMSEAVATGCPTLAASEQQPSSPEAAAVQKARGVLMGHSHVVTSVDLAEGTVSLEEPAQMRPQPNLPIADFKLLFATTTIGSSLTGGKPQI